MVTLLSPGQTPTTRNVVKAQRERKLRQTLPEENKNGKGLETKHIKRVGCRQREMLRAMPLKRFWCKTLSVQRSSRQTTFTGLLNRGTLSKS
jgi:hypothetical protein